MSDQPPGRYFRSFCRPFRATHAAGGEEGKEHYGIPYATGYDIAVCNAYGKANESAIAARFAPMTLKPGGVGTAVLIFDSPEGQVPHYVFRSWGKDYGGRQFLPKVKSVLDLLDIKKLILFSPYPDRMGLDLLCRMDDAVTVKTWAEILTILEMDYPKRGKGRRHPGRNHAIYETRFLELAQKATRPRIKTAGPTGKR